jgi:hypothetical protein
MGRFVHGEDRRQDYLLPASLDDYVSADNPVRAVEAFIDALDLKALEFAGMTPAETDGPLSSGDDAQDLPLWLSEPDPVEPTARAWRSATWN